MHLEIIAGHKTELHTLSAMVIACNLLDEKYVPPVLHPCNFLISYLSTVPVACWLLTFPYEKYFPHLSMVLIITLIVSGGTAIVKV